MTLKELKEVCRRMKLPVSGTKAQLKARIKNKNRLLNPALKRLLFVAVAMLVARTAARSVRQKLAEREYEQAWREFDKDFEDDAFKEQFREFFREKHGHPKYQGPRFTRTPGFGGRGGPGKGKSRAHRSTNRASVARSVLGVSATASKAEIRRAFRKRAKETHPDKGGSNVAFRRVKEAFDILK